MSHSHEGERTEPAGGGADSPESERRDFLGTASLVVMGGALASAYGTLGVMGIQFLHSAGDPKEWQFLATLDELAVGQSLLYQTPAGAKVVVARQGPGDEAKDFKALSSVCPHLGCAVHWEPQNDRFFCPCHNGAFDRDGAPIAGPPKDGGQRLSEFRLMVENGRIYIEVPLQSVGVSGGQVASCGLPCHSAAGGGEVA